MFKVKICSLSARQTAHSWRINQMEHFALSLKQERMSLLCFLLWIPPILMIKMISPSPLPQPKLEKIKIAAASNMDREDGAKSYTRNTDKNWDQLLLKTQWNWVSCAKCWTHMQSNQTLILMTLLACFLPTSSRCLCASFSACNLDL